MPLPRFAGRAILLAMLALVPTARGDVMSFASSGGPSNSPGNYLYLNGTTGALSGAFAVSSFLGQNTPLHSGFSMTATNMSISTGASIGAAPSGGYAYGSGGTGGVSGGTSGGLVSYSILSGTFNPSSTGFSDNANFTIAAQLLSPSATFYGLDTTKVYYGTLSAKLVYAGQNNFGQQIYTASDDNLYFDNALQPASVPEPASLTLLGAGLVSAVALARRRGKLRVAS